MKWGWTGALLAWFATTASCWPYDESLVGYNLNENKEATNPAEYWGEWPDHKGKYFPSPENWRFPFYTLFLDRFVNGDPENDNINGTQFEHDISSNQMRHGGDVAGLVATLDYLQGMGIKGIYLAGTVLMNQPWGADGYSALDTTLLDQHFGNLDTWRNAITEIHKRGMYVVFDNTIATLGDLIGFEGYLNTTTPFSVKEHKALWKTDRRYVDFDIGNDYNSTCDYPVSIMKTLVGCFNSDFDQYGDIEAFGVFPDWQRQLAKFASVQDRLREWVPNVRERLIRHSCIIIASLDIDGFRYDKATQATVDALGEMSMAYRECARAVGKNNFFISGEITGGDYFGSIYLGRGRLQNQWLPDPAQGPKMTNESSAQYFLREAGHEALDSAAFHYSVYRTLTRFLGMDGNLAAGYDVPLDWVDMWRQMLRSNDLVNANTGKFDPGTCTVRLTRTSSGGQLCNGAFYVLDATATNYIYGRQAMSPATAWRDHGCFSLESSQYYKWPIEAGRKGCQDDTVAYDHRDPSHPVRNILKHMYQLREQFPVLNDGYTLNNLSKSTVDVYYPGSNETATETGMWSVSREIDLEVQDFGSDDLNSPVWMVYQNNNHTVDYQFECSDEHKALIAPFPADTVVKNLFYPWDEFTLTAGPSQRTFGNATLPVGCHGNLTLNAFEFRAYVPKELHRKPRPMITGFTPGHDVPIPSTVAPDASENVHIELEFSEEMDCDGVTKSISLTSSTESLQIPSIDTGSVHCEAITNTTTKWTAYIPSKWKWTADLTNVYNGIHQITVKEPKTSSGNASTNATDHFLFRIGQVDNPMVFTKANYSTSLLHEYDNGTLFIQHHAAGADKYRYSTNWGTTWSSWTKYNGGNDTIEELPWHGTKGQQWEGKHVRVEYWSGLTGSSDYYQEGDVGWPHKVPRRFPHIHFNGPFNQFGYDGGLPNKLKLDTTSGRWKYHFTSEWPAQAQINVWGMNPDGRPDQSWVLGDIDGDHVLDRMPPSSLSATMINITDLPPSPHLAWIISINDGTMRYTLEPTGDQTTQMAMYILFWIVPLLTGVVCVYVFMKSFYQVKFNQVGVSEKRTLIPLALRRKLKRARNGEGEAMNPLMRLANKSGFLQSATDLTAGPAASKRRMVLIATMEYDIEDWAIKIKIGGLGVMAQLMGKTLGHQDLIWVVPCVGGVDYPVDRPAEPMIVTILGKPYEVQVQYHTLQNITYVLLDAPVFRQQSKSEPYPPRMDDLDSAIYYSAWNQCIAQTIKRFPIDLYHINDYHGSLAPLYLLPQTIPACLSLHNAEFQGLWPMRTEKEKEEVCSVFNLDKEITRRYVQFGEVFNLLHAGASYLRVHQQGFGAVGVSKKYGKRSYARYPIFWGLKKVGNLPNPDPSDIGEWNREKALAKGEDPPVDQEFEAGRAELKRQAQEWAGLEQNPDADLLVFVGRWSMQKGVDLIADVMPAVLEARPNVQLICVGPVIDLYGKFAALKLDRMMKVYPGRVFSRPQFTALPPYIFSGAEFALIPSRDEPFGLVAVEFGRKGALGIGARVGGLGQMPGWWYNVESMSTTHLLHQFKLAIDGALNSKPEVRAKMRARSAKQRFPVAQWIEDLEILQGTSIRIHNKEASKSNNRPVTPTGPMTPRGLGAMSPTFPASGTQTPVGMHSREASYVNLRQLSEIGPQQRDTIISYSNNNAGREMTEKPAPGLSRKLSLGVRSGPGHLNRPGRRGQGQQDLALPDRRDGGDVSDIEEESDDDFIDHYYGDDEYTLTPEQAEEGRRLQNNPQSQSGRATPRELVRSAQFPSSPSVHSDMGLAPPPGHSWNLAIDFKLQKVDPFFTDSHGDYARLFEKSLENLNAANSESQLCIEEFLVKSEKEWFDKFRDAKLGRLNSPAPSVFRGKRGPSPVDSYYGDDASSRMSPDDEQSQEDDEFLLGKDYVPPTGLRKWMQLRIGDWPVYSLLLGLGQIIAANSYQITLLTGEVGQTAEKLYGIATTYLITSIVWWFVFRYFKSIVCLSVPWFFYGLAFLLIGLAHFEHDEFTRGWIQNVASGFYAVASSSGSIFFALNFGDESGAPVKEWVFRACVIQGTQQAYVIALWYWGSTLTKASSQGLLTTENNIANTWKMTAICVPITVFLWGVGLLMFFGLPNYYRQSPGKVPSFYRSVFRRKIVLWNFAVVIIQNFFLSAPYGRNWNFLWSSNHATTWQIVILCVVFFGFVWAGFLFILSHLSKQHSWILPVFACGLGAPAGPRSGGVSPASGGLTGGALASRSVWLWLGVLDAIQGLGFGMILLQTLTRMHMCFTLIVCQVLGSIATICARAFAPNNVGPGPISPDPTYGASAVANAWFWIALIFQLLICAGFLLFFRREQLSKP
ncbi:alpha-1,3-glucan synthase Ags1 [Aspergillus novofumigatus IBT 16806]|uniref:alpha-1,3-glucan synthase n=1 Tax=Aspergillus novofumigatus (strain IBT 16806) TaxID=1392255 RepID=A0A2I1BV78_ASPN1|nr:putative alpha-1,3-glucan synthase [Aspergillus novofumigatus IBT 16806]PKX89275.1 putative alpha-1,3-glucan synthase [Aspergillus novofumigatus IBT 16806]